MARIVNRLRRRRLNQFPIEVTAVSDGWTSRAGDYSHETGRAENIRRWTRPSRPAERPRRVAAAPSRGGPRPRRAGAARLARTPTRRARCRGRERLPGIRGLLRVPDSDARDGHALHLEIAHPLLEAADRLLKLLEAAKHLPLMALVELPSGERLESSGQLLGVRSYSPSPLMGTPRQGAAPAPPRPQWFTRLTLWAHMIVPSGISPGSSCRGALESHPACQFGRYPGPAISARGPPRAQGSRSPGR